MDALVSLALLMNLADVAGCFAGREKCGCDRTGLDKNPKQYMKIGFSGGEPYWCERCPDIPEDAVYLDNTVCRTVGCKKRAIWAPIGTRDDRLCGPCHKKLPEEDQKKYEDVMSKRCETCEKARAIFAKVSEGKSYADVRPTHCKKCVENLSDADEYKDVSNKRCETCKKAQPVFAKVPEGKTYADIRPTHCKKCIENLTDANEYENVCAKRCETCKKAQALFAKVPEGKSYTEISPTHCGTCVQELSDANEYENVVSKRCEECVLLNEKTVAHYAEDFTGYPRRFCARHAPMHFVCVTMKPCPRCPRNNVIAKNKPSGVCVYCDPNGHQKKYEIAVLDYLKETYDVDKQYPVYVNGRSAPVARIDGIIVSDAITIAIEVDEPGAHCDKEADDRRMNICSEYLTKEYSKPVAWIRINPYIYGGKKNHDGKQFGERAKAKRLEIVDKAAAKIDELIKEPKGDVFRFDSKM